jgi:uroporphyrinogen decarboxylase
MRQAGRSLPEYRELRKRHDLFSVCRQPELCAEVTLQPVRAHDVDAAVMFADIMLPVIGMGVDGRAPTSNGSACRIPKRRCRSSSRR